MSAKISVCCHVKLVTWLFEQDQLIHETKNCENFVLTGVSKIKKIVLAKISCYTVLLAECKTLRASLCV